MTPLNGVSVSTPRSRNVSRRLGRVLMYIVLRLLNGTLSSAETILEDKHEQQVRTSNQTAVFYVPGISLQLFEEIYNFIVYIAANKC
jgi:hypothetical protein